MTGVAAALTAFVLNNQALIIAGILVGAVRSIPHVAHGAGDEPLRQQCPLRSRGARPPREQVVALEVGPSADA
jgi:hypothetical protein